MSEQGPIANTDQSQTNFLLILHTFLPNSRCKRRAIRKRLKRQKKLGGKLLVDLVKLAKIAISPVLGKGLAEFEVVFTNPQFLNAVLQGRRWYSEPRRGPVRARHSPSTSRECVLNDVPFTTGVLIGVCGFRLLRQADSTGIPGQPGCIHAKHSIRTHNDRPLNNILQFANIAWPGIGSK